MLTASQNNSVDSSDQVSEKNNSIKILIADDDITNRLVLVGILSSQGYQLVQAETGAEAVQVFEDESPDLVLMDVMMPVMDGYEASEKIKAICNERFVPIIFLTAITDEVALAKCIEAGGDDFLTKPYNHVILKARIDALLRIGELYNTITKQKEEIGLHQDRMEREAKMAESLFSNIVRSDELQKPYIKYILSPMSLFSGDVLLASENPTGGINVLLGDFTGHGMAAATGALPASSIFYEMTEKGHSVAEIASELNNKLDRILPTGMFMAACLINLDPITRTMTVWNGGLPSLIVYSSHQNKVLREFKSNHVAMGVMDATLFNNRVEAFDVTDGDRFYIYSDGVTETTNPANEMFGEQRLMNIFEKTSDAKEIFTTISKELEYFRDGHEQNDDVTLIEILFDEDTLNANSVESLQQEQSKAKNPSSHWKIDYTLEADALRHSDPLPVIIQSVSELQGLSACRQQLYTIMAELFSNSLEHGLLGLNSDMKTTAEGFAEYYHQRESRLAELTDGAIKIELRHEPSETGGRLAIRIEDTGPGFDYQNHSVSLDDNEGNCGRGVPLLQSMCESVTHYERGNVVEAIYVW